MSTSHQGIDKHKGEMQPSDKDRAQTAHKTSPDKSVSHESTRLRPIKASGRDFAK